METLHLQRDARNGNAEQLYELFTALTRPTGAGQLTLPPTALAVAERERLHREGILSELARVKASGERYRNGQLLYALARD